MKFHSGEIEVQDKAGVRDIAKAVGEGIVDFLSPDAARFLARRQMAVLGTPDGRGRVWASVVTGAPGFIEVIEPRALRIDANSSSTDPLYENPAADGHVGLFAARFHRLEAASCPRPRRNQRRKNLRQDSVSLR